MKERNLQEWTAAQSDGFLEDDGMIQGRTICKHLYNIKALVSKLSRDEKAKQRK